MPIVVLGDVFACDHSMHVLVHMLSVQETGCMLSVQGDCMRVGRLDDVNMHVNIICP